MARIKTDKVLAYSDPNSRYSYRITPEMGVVKHFPTRICAALVAKGAQYVGRKKKTEESGE